MIVERDKIEWQPGHYLSVAYAWPRGRGASPHDALVLAHGAGHSMDSNFISYLHGELARRGFLTVKFNFPYAEPGFRLFRRPDPKRILVSCYRHVLDDIVNRANPPSKVYVGGVSLGAAVASHVVSDEPGRDDVDGLFFLGYPIHQRRQPEELGVRHLQQISKPMLFVAGTQDPWSKPERLNEVVSTLTPWSTVFLVQKGGHNFKVRGVTYSKTLETVAQAIEDWVFSISN